MIYKGDFKNINMITWIITENCNFNCFYCSPSENKILDPIDINKLSQGLNYLQKNWLFHITGGEPFLEKNIVEICQEITKRHYLSLNTNLSTTNHFDFADKINPSKCLFVNAAVHIAEREKRDTNLRAYIEKIHYMQKKGFNIIAYYVAHPALFNRMKKDLLFLKSNGIHKVRIKIFRGIYNGKYFPYSFNYKERKFLEGMEADYPEFEILNKSHKYYNNICLAGQRFFVMDRNGNLKRCSSLLKNYGNLFKESIKYDVHAKPCPINKCGCPYEGIRNTISSKGNAIYTLKENIFEKFLKINKLIHSPRLFKKVKGKTIEYFTQPCV